MYVAHTAGAPAAARAEEDIAKQAWVAFIAGYEAIRSARLNAGKQLGLIDRKWTPSLPAGNWNAPRKGGSAAWKSTRRRS
jgi:hypothetical protein